MVCCNTRVLYVWIGKDAKYTFWHNLSYISSPPNGNSRSSVALSVIRHPVFSFPSFVMFDATETKKKETLTSCAVVK